MGEGTFFSFVIWKFGSAMCWLLLIGFRWDGTAVEVGRRLDIAIYIFLLVAVRRWSPCRPADIFV